MKTRAPESLESLLKSKKPRVAILRSRFNEEITGGLLAGAKRYLSDRAIPFSDGTQLFFAPGAYETPLLAQSIAKTGKFDVVVCLGCVIKGDTAHFEFISLGATIGMTQATLSTGVPITFGILTTYDSEQARKRSADDAHNKGIEAAAAGVEAWAELQRIQA
ncbi:MAG: 6,7-dimethyl-8-ribityllumazine synthase, partial [Bdellovibrionales bacterium]|nr:6,7-dimethyl-8-ribityllumazine synthase [Bdellovibrionales bacterium]